MKAREMAAVATGRVREQLAFDPAKLPIKVGLWYLLVAPVRPKETTEGGLVLAEESKRAEDHLITIGKLLDMGDFCWKSETPSKLKLAEDTRKPKLGDYVLFQQYAGTRIVMKDGRTLIVLTDTEIIGVVPPEEVSNIRFYL